MATYEELFVSKCYQSLDFEVFSPIFCYMRVQEHLHRAKHGICETRSRARKTSVASLGKNMWESYPDKYEWYKLFTLQAIRYVYPNQDNSSWYAYNNWKTVKQGVLAHEKLRGIHFNFNTPDYVLKERLSACPLRRVMGYGDIAYSERVDP